MVTGHRRLGPAAIVLCTSLCACGCDRRPGPDGDADLETHDADAEVDAAPDADADAEADAEDPGLTGTETVDGTTYSFHVPACVLEGGGPAPVIYSFHGSGGNGEQMVSAWRPVADAHCLIVIAMDSGDPRGWGFVDDGLRFNDLLWAIDDVYDIDRSRRYLHGYSAGAHWIYGFGLFYSSTYAGLAVYAGSLDAAILDGIWPDQVGDPIPVLIAHGTDDAVVPYAEALAARDELEEAGWPVRLWTAEGGTHHYDPAHQEEAWLFWEENAP